MNRGRRSESIFSDRHDYLMFIDLLIEASEIYNVNVAAYCLMKNHYHILLQTPDGNISRCMRHLNSVYTQRYNRRHGLDGQLFKGRFKSILVCNDSHLLQLVQGNGVKSTVDPWGNTGWGNGVKSTVDPWKIKCYMLQHVAST